jgi:hypothetical protein
VQVVLACLHRQLHTPEWHYAVRMLQKRQKTFVRMHCLRQHTWFARTATRLIRSAMVCRVSSQDQNSTMSSGFG